MPDGEKKEGNWDRGFGGHQEAQLRRMAALPLREKLVWLEEAHRMVLHLRRRRQQETRSAR